MVKKWIVMSVIAVALVVGCVLEYRFVNGSFDSLHSELVEFKMQIDENSEQIDTEENIGAIEKVHEKWHKEINVLKSLIWHTGLKDIEIGLARIKTYTEENDYTEASAELTSLIDYVQHYSDDFDLSLSNLF